MILTILILFCFGVSTGIQIADDFDESPDEQYPNYPAYTCTPGEQVKIHILAENFKLKTYL